MDAMKPLVSCICPTYGRVPYDRFMLEECVYWFTQQTYDNRELIIVNDAAEQELVCKTDKVTVINLQQRFATLGDKYNYLCAVSKGEIIVPWEDDDVSLPNRIEQIVHRLHGTYEYWRPGGGFFQSQQDAISLRSPGNCFHNASGFKKSLWETRCRYASVSGPQDAVFDQKALQVARVNTVKTVVPSEFNYVYRWQHGSGNQPNLSGHSDTQQAYDKRPTPIAGVYNILPTMYRDYAKLCREYK